MASGSFSLEVRERYLAIADHYIALAEAEVRSDRLARKTRLEQMRIEREKTGAKSPGGLTADRPAAVRRPGPTKPRSILGAREAAKGPAQRGGAGRPQMAAQSDFAIVTSAP